MSNLFYFRLPRLRYDRVSFVVFLFIVLVMLMAAVSRKKNSLADGTEVTVKPLPNGEKLIRESDVRQLILSAFGSLEGLTLKGLDLDRMEKVLEADPFIADADVYVDQRNRLHLVVRQREPLVRVMDNQGGNYYLDANAARMPASKHFTTRTLVATGNIAPYATDFQEKQRNSLKDVYTIARRIALDPKWSAFFQQIHLNNAGEIILVPLIGDQIVILGSAKNLEDKLSRLETFYTEGMPHVGWNTYHSINLKYSGQVVCKR
jgi:cell division protein FtsQ